MVDLAISITSWHRKHLTTTKSSSMCAYAKSTASSTPSEKRSLFSRLTSPLKSRTRNLTDFHIRPKEPHRRYSPGDVVEGAVVLTIVKPVRITHITVCLHGVVRVFKNPNDANSPVVVDPELAAAGDPRKTQYFGNGHASLFNDEVTLCGEGRLDVGIYEFNFELEFPRKGLPTSIDFERGRISYLITATITRPTSIAATSTVEQNVNLVETVDIGPMLPPKPRVISLEPIAKRPKKKKTVKSKEGEANDPSSGSEVPRTNHSPRPDDSASQCGSTEPTGNPRSPVLSGDAHSIHSAGTSADSTVSSSTGLSFRLGPVPSSATKSARDSVGTGSRVSSASEKTITATIECLKAGCLPGDNIPVKISIQHAKAIKSVNGIIVTLYRQGRIDSAPPLSLFKDIKGKQAERLKHEEYYPKSKTGLGGLSLTSAGSSSMFRKDLAQTFAPIIVDPVSLTAIVNASVRVPEDAFPTISCVPGQMITFKYMVEVVVDLGGKIAGHVPATTSGTRNDANPNMVSAFGVSIVDTDHIRREKSVVACVFEVVVGSTDSARLRGRGNSTVKRSHDWAVVSPESPRSRNEALQYSNHSTNADPRNPYPYYENSYDEDYADYDHQDYSYGQESYYPSEPSQPAHSQLSVPRPQLNEGLSEKERLRQAEEHLLPSQPPSDYHNGASSSLRVPSGPSAPPSAHPLGSLDEHYDAESETPHVGPSAPPFSAPSSDISVPHGPSAPPLESLDPNAPLPPTDDKQELERRRLLSEASAPEFLSDEDDNAGEGSSRARRRPQPIHHAPSAPVLPEEDGYGNHYHESLPKYER
ncbi:hypothetical protein HYFRA_00006942 [Hymenoscyphus fraxineus]|uniref:Arrestin C-terminal-like domain-containing protein n=1 Tax=Hymenoscyphus fraxineus TaxID=746836 RepID=A0A9N9KNY3_9HELO|nr:hypothetical protein HYFRA_00006942 [Hymenoscyphus fraxineus]